MSFSDWDDELIKYNKNKIDKKHFFMGIIINFKFKKNII
jgi:hypothetical protein